jgi:hypothetical protein
METKMERISNLLKKAIDDIKQTLRQHDAGEEISIPVDVDDLIGYNEADLPVEVRNQKQQEILRGMFLSSELIPLYRTSATSPSSPIDMPTLLTGAALLINVLSSSNQPVREDRARPSQYRVGIIVD